MVLLFDVGNTNIVLGFVENNKIVSTYRYLTTTNLTEDEYYNKFQAVLANQKIEGIAISSVVPQVDQVLISMCDKYFHVHPLVVGQGVKSGIKIKLENPKQLGADLLCDAVGAKARYNGASIIVDLGTATKFIVVNEKNEFLGGAISPGIMSSLNGMIRSAAKLSDIGLTSPNRIIGNDTQSCIQSGVIYGFASMIDGMVDKIQKELNEEVNVIVTGGLSKYILDVIHTPYYYLPNILLEGLLVIYNKNL